MELADFLTKEQVVTDLKASDRWEAIEELIDLLVDKGRIKSEHREAIVSVVKNRETSMSTGIGFGIGIPHASTDLIGDVTGLPKLLSAMSAHGSDDALLAKLKEGANIEFIAERADGKLVVAQVK